MELIESGLPGRTGPETFPENSFDVIVDKGTMDALFCAGDGGARWRRLG